MAAERYDPRRIEPKWAAAWEAQGLDRTAGDDGRPAFYALDMFPYPSGDLHMGHLRVYSGGDVVARFKRMRGYRVLHPIGWDSFGLPAENAAIRHGVSPAAWTARNIAAQRATFRRLGTSFDWSRSFNTSDPEFYRWTQWLFLRLHERGLAERRAAPVNWCPRDQTVLANEQVVAGRCERCDTPVTRRELTQWFLRITDYADRLLDDMDQLEGGWSERVLTMQRNWIGRTAGAHIDFPVEDADQRIRVFTTRPGTLPGATFVALAPEHPLAGALAEAGGTLDAFRAFRARAEGAADLERLAGSGQDGLFLGTHVRNPVNGDRLPVWVAGYVLPGHGTGAVMGVPAHDERDRGFARRHGLPAPDDSPADPGAIERVTADLAAAGHGGPAVSYRLRDWLISRQRYWGCPIPIIHCGACGPVAVPDEELPVLLPEDVTGFTPKGTSPLATSAAFTRVACPRCGGPARRETDTMDTFVDSSWYFLRYTGLDPARPFDPGQVAAWMPVAQYTGGIEHAILHLLYARFMTKVLYDLGLVPFTEPFRAVLNQGSVVMRGMAMSKSRGNVVEPRALIDRHGADVARLTMLFAGPFEDDVDWARVSAEGAARWVDRVWRVVLAAARATGGRARDDGLRRTAHRTTEQVTGLLERFRFNVVVARLMELTSALAEAVGAGRAGPDTRDAAERLVLLLAPLAPFVTEELWHRLGHTTSVHLAAWPGWDPALARPERVTLVVQVDGRVRDRIPIDHDESPAEQERLALASEAVIRALGGRAVARTITVPGRLINIVTG
jgi:leucyl-tRNA synthetase